MENSGARAPRHSKFWPKDHPYSRMVIGTHESLNNVEMQDVIDFTNLNYRPQHATMMVVGDFTADQIGPMLQNAFPMELWSIRNFPRTRLLSISLTASRVWIRMRRWTRGLVGSQPPVDREISYHKAGVEKKTAIMAWSLPGGYRQDQPLMEITANMLTSAVATYLNPDSDARTDSTDS